MQPLPLFSGATKKPAVFELIGDFRAALTSMPRALFLEYQPKINIKKTLVGKPGSLEALVRWRHDRLGIVMPDHFISYVESDRSLAYGLTETVFRLAGEAAHKLCWKGTYNSIAVNIPGCLLIDANLSNRIEKLVADCRLEPSQFTIEVTETSLISDLQSASNNLNQLRDIGFALSLDDFGIGYSSLDRLYRMPFTELKIDRSFVENIVSCKKMQIIVRSTIELAHNLGLTVCAEGVECIETLKLLRLWDCDKAQGYYLGRPMMAEKVFSKHKMQ